MIAVSATRTVKGAEMMIDQAMAQLREGELRARVRTIIQGDSLLLHTGAQGDSPHAHCHCSHPSPRPSHSSCTAAVADDPGALSLLAAQLLARVSCGEASSARRFLRACGYKVDEAEVMLARHLDWRKSYLRRTQRRWRLC